MTKKLLFSLVLCTALMVSLFGCAEEKKDTKKAKPAREYNAMILQTATRKLNSTYSAIIRGKQDVDIRTKVEGYITDIKVKEGSMVKRGQVLFIIDQKQYQAALATAEALVDAAQAKVDEAQLSASSKEMLFKENIVFFFKNIIFPFCKRSFFRFISIYIKHRIKVFLLNTFFIFGKFVYQSL